MRHWFTARAASAASFQHPDAASSRNTAHDQSDRIGYLQPGVVLADHGAQVVLADALRQQTPDDLLVRRFREGTFQQGVECDSDSVRSMLHLTEPAIPGQFEQFFQGQGAHVGGVAKLLQRIEGRRRLGRRSNVNEGYPASRATYARHLSGDGQGIKNVVEGVATRDYGKRIPRKGEIARVADLPANVLDVSLPLQGLGPFDHRRRYINPGCASGPRGKGKDGLAGAAGHIERGIVSRHVRGAEQQLKRLFVVVPVDRRVRRRLAGELVDGPKSVHRFVAAVHRPVPVEGRETTACPLPIITAGGRGRNSSEERSERTSMSTSASLRLRDVRRVFGLIGECRDLRSDPRAWRAHAFDGLRRLLGARGATGGEVQWHSADDLIRFLHPVVSGFSAAETAVFAAFMRQRDASQDPTLNGLRPQGRRLVTRTRQELVHDAVWYRSISFNEHRRVVGVDHCVYSLHRLAGDDTYSLIGLHRALAGPGFSGRERRLLHLFHDELGRLTGPTLSRQPHDVGLSPRLKQTLERLLHGDSEKEIASHLTLSLATVHQYVTALYRHFGVSSRAELLARFIRSAH